MGEQDALTETIRARFPDNRCIDRRERPSHGYRAVHIVARVDGLNVEIQVRTELQNLWAQLVERLADRLGRGVRYGQAPDDERGQEVMALAIELSDVLRRAEVGKNKLRTAAKSRERWRAETAAKLASMEADASASAHSRIGFAAVAANWRVARIRRLKRRLSREDQELWKGQQASEEQERKAKEALATLVARLET